jgi:preprotein translocase subunit SecY
MHKPILFAITAVVLLAAIVTVTLYTVNAANAQGNATRAGGALKNMTNATGGKLKNMTSGAMGAIKGAIGGK